MVTLDEMTKEKIYREVKHKYLLEDAKQQVEKICGWRDIDIPEDVDYEYLVDAYERDRDCYEADTWERVINQYFETKED